MSLALFLAGIGLKTVVKNHFLRIRVIYTPEQHPMGFSVPRTQAKAVRGVKDKKAGKNCFPQRIFLDRLLTECKQTSASRLLTDSPQASPVFPCCAEKQSLQALLWGTLLAHCSGKPPPHTQAHFPVPHFTCYSRQAFPNYSPQPGPARSGLSSPSPSTCKTPYIQGWNPSAVPALCLWQTLRKSMGLGMTAVRDFPCHGKPQQAEQPPSCFFLAFPIPENLQGQVGWNPERPDLVGVIPVHGKRFGTRWSVRSFPTQNHARILW